MIFSTPRRLPIALMSLALLAAIGCSDERPDTLTGPVVEGPNLNESGEEPTEDRGEPVWWDGEHNSHYTPNITSAVSSALGRTGFEGAITSVVENGGHFQGAVRTAPVQGFPLQGSSYLSISSGDARTPGFTLATNVPCQSVAPYGTLCNIGGLNVTVNVPSSATTLTFQYRYWSFDYCSFLDPFRVFLVPPGGVRTQIAISDLSTDIGCPNATGSGMKWSPHLRTVNANVAAYAGQTVVLEFRASDRSDRINPAGAIIDDLHFDVPVIKPAPTATFNAPSHVNEGASAAVSFSAPSAAGVRYAFDCGSGYGAIGTASSASCPAADNGHLVVKGKVIDAADDNLFTEYTAEIHVENVAPTATFGNDGPVDEGSAFQLQLTNPQDVAADVAAGFKYAFDCGLGYGLVGTASSASCPTTDDGVRAVKGKVIDKDNGETEYTASVTINNVAPTAILSAPASVLEGSNIQLALTGASDASSDDVAAGFSYAFDCGSGYGPFGASSSASCPTSDNETRGVKAKIRDKDGDATEYTASVNIMNVAPVVTGMSLPAGPVAVGTPITIGANFTDVGTGDTHTASFDLDNGSTTAGVVVESNGSGSSSANVSYSEAGVYTIRVTITDDDGGSGTRSSVVDIPAYIVVYDPDAGFVTGGGWIMSPAGAYAADPTLSGKASFGFVAKYHKGATTPDGNTEFQFKAGNLNFHSSSYEWLVVAGSKAKYKGEGTINGAGRYGFMLTAIDGDKKNNGDPDAFRIKIWDLATGSVVYDNQMGEIEDSDASTALGGGSIVIHEK